MNHDELLLDSRTREDLYRRVEELAASYTPEWRFSRQEPDVGSTLALLFAGQMADNLRRLNRLPEKYHTEFVNLLGLTLQPASPALGVVVAEVLGGGTTPGAALPRGTRLLGDGADGEPVMFETVGDVYLTSARITDIVSISGAAGRIRPLLGGPKPAQLLPASASEEGPEGEPEMDQSEEEMPSFGLFDCGEPGIEKNALLLYHRSVFSGGVSAPICVSIQTPEGEPLLLTDSEKWRWSYYGEKGLIPFENLEVRDRALLLRRELEPEAVESCHMICLEALGPVEESITVSDIRLASERESVPPELILHNGEVLEAEECMPFGETVSLFDECYICDNAVFSQQSAEITLRFRLSSREKMLYLTPQQESSELKIIKRKPRSVQYDAVTTSPERIALEYFNGQGWRRLACSHSWSNLMDGTRSGEFAVVFACPEDWASVPVNGYEGRSLRIRVTQADNCYLLPCRHTLPVLRDVTLSYTYRGQWKEPQRVRTVCGTQTKELPPLNGEPVTIFQPLPHPAAALYLGFDRPLEGAPVSMLFDVEENVHFRMEPVTFEYSTRSGFQPLKVVDGTGNFSSAGTVLFMPPADFAAVEVEGVRRWWLRLRGGENAVQGYHAPIQSIRLNAVDIRSQQTQPEETFTIETAAPNMVFPLAAENILSAEVFVNELGQLSRSQMREMQEQQPENVRAEQDFLGEMTAFFVRWTEVDTFDRSRPGDRHYQIDRVQNALVFGDGVNVRIPQARQDTAITVRPVSCEGARGNVPAGAVNRFFGNVLYVESVYNPKETCAGSDLEDAASARRRSADLLSGRGRLVSEADFTRAARAFSGEIEKVKCLAGVDIDGRPDPSLITIAVMTRDQEAFHHLREPLRKMLLERCDAALAPEHLILSEPVYVEISVSVWVKLRGAARAFDVQNLILESIRTFLNPLSGNWSIGRLPTEGQLKMLLQSLRFPGHVGRMTAAARYVDRDGPHEAALDEMPSAPFAIGVEGKHQIHIEFQERG